MRECVVCGKVTPHPNEAGLCVKPKRYLDNSWAEINEVVRSLGGKWIPGQKPADGAWRIPK